MKLNTKIAPSMMCVNLFETERCIKIFEENDISYLHIDVMDGVFTPNYTLGTDYVKQLRKLTDIPLDIHLMITNPENKLGWFDIKQDEYVSIHFESTCHVQRVLKIIKDAGAKPMIALNPATPTNVLDHILDDIYAVLLMTVNPGFAGQALIPSTLDKISELRKYLDGKGCGHIEIEVDGNVSFENAEKMRKNGANIFVAGSSSLFSKDLDLSSAIDKLKKAIN